MRSGRARARQAAPLQTVFLQTLSWQTLGLPDGRTDTGQTGERGVEGSWTCTDLKEERKGAGRAMERHVSAFANFMATGCVAERERGREREGERGP